VTQYTLYNRLGGPHGQSGWVWKIFPHRDPWTVEPVVGHCTNYAALAGAEPSEKVLSGKADKALGLKRLPPILKLDHMNA